MGMVWPWFIGIFMDAMLKHYGSKNQVKTYFKNTFSELWTVHLEQYGLFHISELFRPNPPFVAKACISQASSEAEVIRVLETLKI
jgi:glycogen debranching enzyme